MRNSTTEQENVAGPKQSDTSTLIQCRDVFSLQGRAKLSVTHLSHHLGTDLASGPYCHELISSPVFAYITPENLIHVQALSTTPATNKKAVVIAIPIQGPLRM